MYRHLFTKFLWKWLCSFDIFQKNSQATTNLKPTKVAFVLWLIKFGIVPPNNKQYMLMLSKILSGKLFCFCSFCSADIVPMCRVTWSSAGSVPASPLVHPGTPSTSKWRRVHPGHISEGDTIPLWIWGVAPLWTFWIIFRAGKRGGEGHLRQADEVSRLPN